MKRLEITWRAAKAPIAKIEAYAILMGVASSWDAFKHRDIMWYVDNTTVLHAMIRGATNDPDVHAMVQIVYLLAFIGNIRIYWEYVESDSNWADGASRVLIDDPWARENQFELQEIACAALDTTPLLQRVVHFAAQIGGGMYSDVRVALRQFEAA